MLKYHHPLGLLIFTSFFSLSAQQPTLVSLSANSHVCNAETEVARLAQNEQLREMARALVEFKPTQYCFILPEAANVAVLAKQAGYIKFDYKSQVLFTFSQYITAETAAVKHY